MAITIRNAVALFVTKLIRRAGREARSTVYREL
jgi:hypothetical protein